jgi:hypothetical protein
MKKVIICWTEFHNYEAEIEIPEGLTKEEEIDWITLNTDEWDADRREPYEINTDWDSFEIEEVK